MIGAGSRRSWPHRLMAVVGAATIRSVEELLLSASLAATVLVVAMRRDAWRRVVWSEQLKVLHEVAIGSLATTFGAGILVGFTLVSQAIYWLDVTGTTGVVGPILIVLLIREFTPILVGLILFGRSGTATLIELSEARNTGWQHMIERQGLDPLVVLVLPRAFGFAVGAFCMATVLVLTTLVTGYLLGHALGLIRFSIWDFGVLVLRGTSLADFVVPPLKCLVIGFLVALATSATALGGEGRQNLRRIVPLGFVRSAMAILLANTLIDVVT